MKRITPVLHVGQVGDHPLRFFRSPLDGPDVPWHSVDDLHACLRFSRELRRTLRASLQKSWAASIRTIATESGVTTIAPHVMAQGLIGAAEEVGCAPYTAEQDYARAGGYALGLVTGCMSPLEVVAFVSAAYHRGGGL